MRLILNSFLLCLCFSVSAQQNNSLKSDIQLLRNSPGKIIKSKIIFEDRFTGISSDIGKIFLIQVFEFNGTDTLKGIELNGNITEPMGMHSDLRRKYDVILDYSELDALLGWFALVKSEISTGRSSDKEQLTYSPMKGNILFRYFKDNFEIQFDCNDENSVLQISIRQMEKFIKDLNEIERWNK